MVRSLENFPELATFKMALRVHSSGFAYKSQQPLIRIEIRLQVRQMHVVIAVGQERVPQSARRSQAHSG